MRKKTFTDHFVCSFLQASTIHDSDFGADVFAQRFMMMLVLKDVSVNISLVDAIKTSSMKKLPALQFGDLLLEDPAKIEEFLEKLQPPLASKNDEVNKCVWKGAGSAVYHKFCLFLKNTDPSTDERLKANLIEELRNLDTFLLSDSMPGKYLGGDSLLLPDCILLPKLLHIKTVSKVFKDFEIPEEFQAIHRYMDAASGKDGDPASPSVVAFTRTCPSDEIIADAWARSMNCRNPLKQKKKKPSTSET